MCRVVRFSSARKHAMLTPHVTTASVTTQALPAIRASNAQFDDPDTLGRLRIRLMLHAGGESGWDGF